MSSYILIIAVPASMYRNLTTIGKNSLVSILAQLDLKLILHVTYVSAFTIRNEIRIFLQGFVVIRTACSQITYTYNTLIARAETIF